MDPKIKVHTIYFQTHYTAYKALDIENQFELRCPLPYQMQSIVWYIKVIGVVTLLWALFQSLLGVSTLKHWYL